MPDKWAQYAAPAEPQGGDKWAQYAQTDTPPPVHQPSLSDMVGTTQQAFDKAITPEPHGTRPGVMGNLETGALNVGKGLLSLASPLVHPQKTFEDAARGLPPIAAFQDVQHLIDPSKPGSIYQEQAQGAAEHPLESGEEFGGQMLGGKMLSAGSTGLRNLRPTPSSDIVPAPEMAARRLSQAILPATKDASNFIGAAPQEVPNILDYARRTNNPLKTQLEFSKAAEGHAREVRDFYENKILKPNDDLLKTTGSGFGDRSGEGPDTYAKASAIDRRIVEINKQLDKPTLNVDDQRRALASKGDLQSEASRLRDILHQHLSQATGLQPGQIADIRQQVGRSYELANDTNAAVTGRMQGEGGAALKDFKMSEIPSKILNFARGGPTAIADRAFQRSIRNFPGEAQGLPAINPPAPIVSPPQRSPMWQGITSAGQPPLRPIVGDVEGATEASLAKRTPRIMEQVRQQNAARAAQAEAAQQEAASLARARELQAEARKLRSK